MLEASKVDYVVHLAAVTSPLEFEDPSSRGYEVNVMGTYNVFVSALRNKVKRVVFASSSAVYGNLGVPAIEEMLPPSYGNLYPLTKLVNELTAKTFLSYGLDSVALRYFNTYRVGEDTKGAYSSVVYKFLTDVLQGRRPVIYGDGTQGGTSSTSGTSPR